MLKKIIKIVENAGKIYKNADKDLEIGRASCRERV